MRLVPANLGSLRRYTTRIQNRDSSGLLQQMTGHLFEGLDTWALSLDPLGTTNPVYVGVITWKLAAHDPARIQTYGRQEGKTMAAALAEYVVVTGIHVDPKMRRQSVGSVLWQQMESRNKTAQRVFCYVSTLAGVGFLRKQKIPMWNLLESGVLVADGPIAHFLQPVSEGVPSAALHLLGEQPPMTNAELDDLTESDGKLRAI